MSVLPRAPSRWMPTDARRSALDVRDATSCQSRRPTASSLPRSGLTLIELLSALSILAIIIGALAIILNNATDLWGSARTRSRLLMQGRAALETIGQDLRQAVVTTNQDLSLVLGSAPSPLPLAYATTNDWIQFCRYTSHPASNHFAFEQVNYAVTTNGGRLALGRWTTQLQLSSSPQEMPHETVTAVTGPTNLLADALASCLMATNGPCVDIDLALLDPDDARTAAGISNTEKQKAFVERHAVRINRRIHLPAQTPEGLP